MTDDRLEASLSMATSSYDLDYVHAVMKGTPTYCVYKWVKVDLRWKNSVLRWKNSVLVTNNVPA